MAGGRLTTHVLDTMAGKPARGMRLELHFVHGDHTHHLLDSYTNADGRVDQPLLEDEFQQGEYEIRFHVGSILSASGSRSKRRSSMSCRSALRFPKTSTITCRCW